MCHVNVEFVLFVNFSLFRAWNHRSKTHFPCFAYTRALAKTHQLGEQNLFTTVCYPSNHSIINSNQQNKKATMEIMQEPKLYRREYFEHFVRSLFARWLFSAYFYRPVYTIQHTLIVIRISFAHIHVCRLSLYTDFLIYWIAAPNSIEMMVYTLCHHHHFYILHIR